MFVCLFVFCSFVQGNRKVYKSSRYEYSSSETKKTGGVKGPQPKSYESVEPTTVSQLDNLLDDLKQERDYSFDKGNSKNDHHFQTFF